jgi:carbon storage regulator
MLVLSRKLGEKVVIGPGITITVVETAGNRVRLGIEAPPHVRILRGELAEWITRPSSPSAEVAPDLVVTHG